MRSARTLSPPPAATGRRRQHPASNCLLLLGGLAAGCRYLSWDDYFMAVAFLSAQRSKDPNKQVLLQGRWAPAV